MKNQGHEAMKFKFETYNAKGLLLSSILFSSVALLISFVINITASFPVLEIDEWNSLNFYIDRGLGGSVFCTHNGHPMAFPNLAYRVLLLATHGDPVARGLSVWLVVLASALLVAFITMPGKISKQIDKMLFQVSAILFICALYTWMVMHHMLLWNISLSNYLAVFGTALSSYGFMLWCNSRHEKNYSAIATILMGAVIATWSHSIGASVWGALAVALFLVKKDWRYSAGAFLIGVLFVIGTYKGMPACSGVHSGGFPKIETLAPLDIALFVISNLGAAPVMALGLKMPLAIWLASAIGLLGVGILMWFSWTAWRNNNTDGKSAGLVMFTWFFIGASALIAIGRTGKFGLDLALAPRFLMMSVGFLTGIAALLLHKIYITWKSHPRLHLGEFTVLALTSALLAASNWHYIYPTQWLHAKVLGDGIQLAIAQSPEAIEQIAKRFQPNHPETVLKGLPALRQNRWDLFRNPLLKLVGKPIAGLDLTVTGKRCTGQIKINERSRAGRTVRISGWTRYPDGHPAKDILIVRDGVIAGIAKRDRTYWLGTYRTQTRGLSVLGRFIARILPIRLGYTLGLHAEWVGAMTAPDTDGRLDGTIYVKGASGRLCEVVT